MNNNHEDRSIILYDGVCGLCDRSVRFIIKHDNKDCFLFAALQSPRGQDICKAHGISPDLSTFYLIEGGQVYERSCAWMKILSKLDFPWNMLSIFQLVPKPVRDFFYNYIGNRRYKWFGNVDYCPVPDPKVKRKFLQ